MNSIWHPLQTESGHHCDETLRGENGKGYRGCQTKTRGGYTCQSWSKQSPHAHGDITPPTKPNDAFRNLTIVVILGGRGSLRFGVILQMKKNAGIIAILELIGHSYEWHRAHRSAADANVCCHDVG